MSTLTQSCQPEDVLCGRTKNKKTPWCWFPDSLSKCRNKQSQSRPHAPSFFSIRGVLVARPYSRHDKEKSNALTLIIQLPSRIKYLDFHTVLTASAVYQMLTVINSRPNSGAAALIKSSILVRRCTNQRQTALGSQSSNACC